MTSDYRISHLGKMWTLPAERVGLAQSMDKDGDHLVSDKEILDFYGIPDEPNRSGHDREGRLNENKWALRALPNPDAKAYHNVSQVADELAALQEKYPDLCERVAVGKSSQGETIWALRISENVHEDCSHKTGVVITGCHHAREWMSVEVPLYSAGELLKSYAEGDEKSRERLKSAEIWFVPCVNPDGYTYSLENDNLWRKNRTPIDTVVDGNCVHDHGVDLNRNYFDGAPENMKIYRPPSDAPGSTKDDFEWGADDPHSAVFRGLEGGAEPEVDAMQRLKLGNPNIRGVIDYHSFGESILYPYGYTQDAPKDIDLLKEIGQKINEAAGGQMALKSSAGLYPITGNALDIQDVNGIISYTLEINGCFQPKPEEIQPTVERFHPANMVFVDELIAKDRAGLLPQRSVPQRYQA